MKGKTVFITGASRGIGKAIGLRLAKEGANIIVAAKTVTPHPKLPGTIHSAAAEMVEAGGQSLAIQLDVRSEENVEAAMNQAAEHFGGIDILINNASAIQLSGIEHTPMKRYDLMHAVNVRGSFLASQKAIPFLKKSENPHILNLSPPLDMSQRWFSSHVAYTMTKYGMSMLVLGLSDELQPYKIAVNALWPKTTIATAAVKNLLGGSDMIAMSRTPEIVGDAAYEILNKKSTEFSGHFCIDEEILSEAGMTDFDGYAVDPSKPLMPDLFL